MDVERDIVDAGAQIVWVLQADVRRNPGTRALCDDLFDNEGSERGICVGDNQTRPEAGTFSDSPFTFNRGFDMIVDRQTMEIVWTTSHGTTSGSENISGAAVLDAVEAAVANAAP